MTGTTSPPEDLTLRGKPRFARRFKRNALIGIIGAGALLIFGSLGLAFSHDPNAATDAQTELYNTTNRVLPPQLNKLAVTYEDVQPRRLGPPLPGDLGFAMLGVQPEASADTDNPFQFRGDAEQRIATPQHVQPAPQETSADSALFFINHSQSDAASGQPDARPSNEVSQLARLTLPDQSPALVPTTAQADPNRQNEKVAFLGAEVDAEIYNPHRIQTPISPYQVMAGTIIPASLVTGLNSDLPGQVIAQVTENVFDTPTGRHLLIPQGSRLIGRYDSVVAFGQSRALVAWSRVIMPDGTSMTLENLPGADLAGFAGLRDRVDNHTLQIFQAAILSSILSVASEIGRDTNDSNILEALRDGGQRTINEAGQQIVQRQLNVQPTISVRPGHRLRVLVNKDLVLQPYGGQ